MLPPKWNKSNTFRDTEHHKVPDSNKFPTENPQAKKTCKGSNVSDIQTMLFKQELHRLSKFELEKRIGSRMGKKQNGQNF
jgi:hypothetical protein